jgi:hypothetical protein
MNVWMKRALQTGLLTGGLLAVGTGIASADENDLSVDLLGVNVTVPVADGATLPLPVTTGDGSDLTVGGDGGLTLPLDTATTPGSTVGGDPTGGLSLPLTVAEADATPAAPADGLAITLPVDTSGAPDSGTTISLPVVTGDLADVVDGNPTTGNDVDVNLDDLVVVPADGATGGVDLGLEDLVTIGGTDGATGTDTVLDVPVSADEDADSTLGLPIGTDDAPLGGLLGGLGNGLADGSLLTGNDVDVNLGQLVSDGTDTTGDTPVVTDPFLSLPVDTGDLLEDGGLLGDALPADGAVTGNDVAINLDDVLDLDGLGDALGVGGLLDLDGVTGGDGTGSVITVPVNTGSDGTAGDNGISITLPVDLAALIGGPGTDGPGTDGPGTGGPGTGGPGTGGPGTDGPTTGGPTTGGPTTGGPTTSGPGTDGTGVRSGLVIGATSGLPTAVVDGNATAGDDADGSLAYTGSDLAVPALAGLVALLLGLALTVGARRRTGSLIG